MKVNTIEMYDNANGMPTAREQAVAGAINIKLDAMDDSHIILIPKNATYEDIIKYLLGEE